MPTTTTKKSTYKQLCVMTACSVVSDSLCLYGLYPPGSSVHPIFKQEYCSGLPFPTLGHLLNWEIKPALPLSPALQVDFYHLSHVIWYLFFSVWLTSLIVIIPRSVHAVSNGIFSFFFNGWIIFHCVYMYHPFFYPVIFWWAFSLLPCKGCCK